MHKSDKGCCLMRQSGKEDLNGEAQMGGSASCRMRDMVGRLPWALASFMGA